MDLALAPRTAARRVRVRPRSLKIPITVACLLAGGCSQFREVHYLKSTVAEGQTPNYFRVNVDGWTFMSSSRYTSGYFDETAVDTYFGGFKQPDDGKMTGVACKSDAGEVTPLAGKDGGTLILLLSSNADDIANSLNALAQSEAITQALTGIVSRDRIEASEQAKANAPGEEATGTALATLGDSLVGVVPAEGATPPTAAAARAQLLAYANALAASLAPGTQFQTLADAKAWVRAYQPSQVGTGGTR